MSIFRSLRELQAFTEKAAEDVSPELADEEILRPSALSDEEIGLLRSELALPESYLECARQFDLRGMSLGYFQIGPYRQDVPLLDQLRQVNAETSFETLTREHLVVVGGLDADLVCVVSNEGAVPGQVAVVSIENGPPVTAKTIASSYGEFMLAAGSLWRLGLEVEEKEQSIPKPAVEGFLRDLRGLLADQSIAEAWRSFAEELLL